MQRRGVQGEARAERGARHKWGREARIVSGTGGVHDTRCEAGLVLPCEARVLF
jgi:hypothetical protein